MFWRSTDLNRIGDSTKVWYEPGRVFIFHVLKLQKMKNKNKKKEIEVELCLHDEMEGRRTFFFRFFLFPSLYFFCWRMIGFASFFFILTQHEATHTVAPSSLKVLRSNVALNKCVNAQTIQMRKRSNKRSKMKGRNRKVEREYQRFYRHGLTGKYVKK